MRKILLLNFFLFLFAATSFAVPINVAGFALSQWQAGGGSANLRVYASTSFVASDGSFVIGSRTGSPDVYKKAVCTVSASTVTCPPVVIQSTTDGSTTNAARYTVAIYDARGAMRIPLLKDVYVPASAAPDTTWAAIDVINNSHIATLPPSYLTADQVATLVNASITSSRNSPLPNPTFSGSITLGDGSTPITRVLSGIASLNFAGLVAGSCEQLDVGGFTGLSDGDAISLGLPSALTNNSGAISFTSFTAFVKNATTATVRRCNPGTSAAFDPPAATVRVTVIKF